MTKPMLRYLLIVCLIFATIAQNISAHAFLIESSPSSGALLEESPDRIQLILSESVESEFSSFELHFGIDHEHIVLQPLYSLGPEGEQIVKLDFDSALEPDVYTLAYKVLSKVDGHITAGTIPFAVAVQNPTMPSAASESTELSSVRLIVRWLDFIVTMLLVGGLFFPLLLTGRNESCKEAVHRRLIILSAGFLLFTSLADIILQVLMLQSNVLSVLVATQWGIIRFSRFILASALVLAYWSNSKALFIIWFTRILAVIILMANALSGHSAELSVAGIAGDIVHQFAAALWIGGLTQLALIWLPRRVDRTANEKSDLLIHLILRFSNLALLTVPLLVAVGAILAIQQIGAWEDLLNTAYGQAVLAKSVLFVPVVVFAAINRCRIIPRIKSKGPSRKILLRLRKLVTYELAILVLVLAFAASLTLSSPPATGQRQSPNAAEIQPQIFIFAGEENSILLSVQNAHIGYNRFTIEITSPTGDPIQEILKVWVRFEHQVEDLGFVEVDANSLGDAKYLIEGAYLNLPGEWLVSVFVRKKGQASDLQADFAIEVD